MLVAVYDCNLGYLGKRFSPKKLVTFQRVSWVGGKHATTCQDIQRNNTFVPEVC